MKKLKKFVLVLVLFLGTFAVASATAIDIYICNGKIVGVNVYDDGKPGYNVVIIND